MCGLLLAKGNWFFQSSEASIYINSCLNDSEYIMLMFSNVAIGIFVKMLTNLTILTSLFIAGTTASSYLAVEPGDETSVSRAGGNLHYQNSFATQLHEVSSPSDLEAFDRHQRQIRFKGSYQELPKGLPHQESEEDSAHHNDLLSYFIEVDVNEEPHLDMNFRDLPRGSSTYFPPEVIPLDLLYSSEEEGSIPFLDFHEEHESKAEDPQAKSSQYTGPSPFYIPPSGNLDDNVFIIHPSTEPPIYLAKDLIAPYPHRPLPRFNSPEIEYYHNPDSSVQDENTFHIHPDTSRDSEVQTYDNFETNENDLNIQIASSHSQPPFTSEPYVEDSATLGPSTAESGEIYFITGPADTHSNDTTEFSFSTTTSINSTPIHYTSTTPVTIFHSSSSPLTSQSTPQNLSPTLTPPRKLSHTNKIPNNDLSIRFPKSPNISNKGKTQKHSDVETQNSRISKGKSGDNAIIGISGVDYPVYQTVPDSNFDCSTKEFGGYYADPETRCQVFHVCLGRKSAAFLCPVGTMFNQDLLVCDWWYNVECKEDSQHQI